MSELIDQSHSTYKPADFDISQGNRVAIFTRNHGERL